MPAPRDLTVFVLQFFVLLLALKTVGAAQIDTNHSSSIDLNEFLHRARKDDLIDQTTSNKLLQLAANLTGSAAAHPTRLNLPGAEKDGSPTFIKEETQQASRELNFFRKFYNQLTLLNILYFGGALLVMGAYTLFMTLAYERCSYAGLSWIMLVQVAGFGLSGIFMWQSSEEFQFVGGLLCTISTSMVPFMVYNMHRALGLWPEREPGVFQGFRTYIHPSWVVMEIATIICGLGYLRIVRFPFLLFPVSFSAWFLSMDLAPLYPKKKGMDFFEIRRRISIAFGMGMILLGYLMELRLGSEPDLSFWVYLFGLMTFTGALHSAFRTHDDLQGSIFLLINMGLILIGSRLDRTTFHVFGSLEIIMYMLGYFTTKIKMSTSVSLWLLKALCAAALFSQALLRGGGFEVFCALVTVVVFNFNYIVFAASGELYSIFLLLTNLGFVASVAAFSRPLDLWLFTLPDAQLPVGQLCSLCVAIFHTNVLIKYFASGPTSFGSCAYLAYRLLASVAISFVFAFLRQPHLAWVGGLGIPAVALVLSQSLRTTILNINNRHYGRHRRDEENEITLILLTFATLFFGIAFSIYLQSNILYLICCVFMLVSVLSLMEKWKELGCLLAVCLILLSVPLQSKFVITIGAVYMFVYLSYLAYDVFKNSLLFPLALIGIGIGLIYSGIMYQRHESALHSQFQGLIPAPIQTLMTQTIYSVWEEGGKFDWYGYIETTKFSWSNFIQAPYKWGLWSGAMIFALVGGSPSVVSYMCAGGIVVLVYAYILVEVRESHKEHLDDKVKVTSLTFELSSDPTHEQHGTVIKVTGTKPRELASPTHIALAIRGTGFWNAVSSTYGEFAASMARSMFLPYTLTPHLISFTDFQPGSCTFSATIQLATGHKGSRRAKHSTIKGAIGKLASRGNKMSCVVLYSNAWYHPWSTLCVKEVTLSEMKRQLCSN